MRDCHMLAKNIISEKKLHSEFIFFVIKNGRKPLITSLKIERINIRILILTILTYGMRILWAYKFLAKSF